jgi:tRNA G26 N,N-dimethylase Trm1
MKTIELSNEMYEKLVALSNEMNSQDHRGTAMPYFFQVMETKKIYGVDGDYDTDGYVWVKDGTTQNTVESMIEALENDEVEFDKENATESFLENLMEENGYVKGYYRNEEVYSNAFFSEKSCKEHIQANKYHYESPVDYLSHAFRNPDMELISKFLCELTGGKIHI